MRYGPEQPLPRRKRIHKRWKRALPIERDAQDDNSLSQHVVADLVNATNETKLLRFEKQLDCKGLEKTDLWKTVV